MVPAPRPMTPMRRGGGVGGGGGGGGLWGGGLVGGGAPGRAGGGSVIWIRAAVLDGEAHAGVARVIGGGGAAKFVTAEDLGAVFDDAVHQRAFGNARVREGLFNAEGGVEIPHRDGGAALGSDVN